MKKEIRNMKTPIILNEGTYTEEGLAALKNNNKIWQIKDIYESQINELFEINNAKLIGKPEFKKKLKDFKKNRFGKNALLKGNYIYFPWSGILLHSVNEKELNLLRTNRTNNLLTREEQITLGNFSSGIAGLSFGNGIALSLVYAGASKNIKIADTDIFETTNLNRVRVGLPSVNIAKTQVTAQEIYEINPYANVEIFEKGLTSENVSDFIGGKNNLNIIFDVVDDFSMKVRIRLAAKKAKIPVVMLTSLEDSILVDIERFDLNPNSDIFHGLLGDVTDDLLNKKMTEKDKARYAMAIVGVESVSYRNLLSLSEIGTNLVSRPHLFGTVSIVCGLAAYIIKRIALNEDMPSKRKLLKFNEILGIEPNNDDTPQLRQKMIEKLMSK